MPLLYAFPGPPFTMHCLFPATKYLQSGLSLQIFPAVFTCTLLDAEGLERRVSEVAVLVVNKLPIGTELPGSVHGHGQNDHQEQLHQPEFHFLRLI